MKYLLLTLALLVALPSIQAGGCGMGTMQGSITQAAGEGHDCCPSEAADEGLVEEPCEDGGHCAGCIITVAVVPLTLASIEQLRPLASFTVLLPALVPSHSAPPYRPPIS